MASTAVLMAMTNPAPAVLHSNYRTTRSLALWLLGLPMYNYQSMKASRRWLRKELNEYLFHPSRVRTWIFDGNNIENYLN